ncbi:neurexin-1-like [Paramacrobiotus metropolitanus]|uniref:neurexin-1-like n=1 Tax=Paramacrobiotus metropolitanus TaxID=2943436 RepID=UPI0024459B80|nr:neurexin-1-like [Paramacrobiotus metropolitanus]
MAIIKPARMRDRREWSDISLLLFLLTLAWRSALAAATVGYRLNGMESSFLHMTEWTPSPGSWNFSFEFRTNHSTGLLLYADDVRSRAFVLLRLTESEATQEQLLECRLQIPTSPTLPVSRHHEHHLTLSLRRPPHDHQWSIVQLSKTSNVFSVALSSSHGQHVEKRTLPSGSVFTQPPVAVCMGGMAGNLSRPLTHPSVLFEPRFRGLLRQIMYETAAGKDPQVVSHGGMEVIHETGLCEKEHLAGENDFLGKDFLSFYLQPPSTIIMDGVSEFLHLSFRSRQANGVIICAKTSSNGFLTFYLQQNRLIFTGRFAAYTVREQFEPDTKRDFRDYVQYNISVHLQSDPPEITVSINGKSRAKRLIASGEKYEEIGNIQTLLLGGISDAEAEEAKVENLFDNTDNFHGTVLDLFLQHGNVRHDLFTRSIKRYPHTNQSAAPVTFTCQRNSKRFLGPMNFCGAEQYLLIGTGSKPFRALSVKFKTTEASGLLLLHRENNASLTAVDMYDGQLGLLIQRAAAGGQLDEASRIPVSALKTNDGAWHELNLTLDERSGIGQIQLDDAATEFIIGGSNEPGVNLYSKLSTTPKSIISHNLYIGGAPAPLSENVADLWSVQSGATFRGLIKKISLNKKPVDIGEQLDKWSCPHRPFAAAHCPSNPCANGGKCREGWQRYTCDCQHTAFSGLNCQQAASEMRFDDSNPYVKYEMPAEEAKPRQVTSLSFRFRSLSISAFILKLWCLNKAASDVADDALVVALVSGKIKVTLSAEAIMNDKLEWTVGEALNDDKWHFVKFHRHGKFVKIVLDNYELAETSATLDGISLHYCRLDLGKQPGTRSKKFIRASRLPLNPPPPTLPGPPPEPPPGHHRRAHLPADHALGPRASSFSFQSPEAFVTLEPLQADPQLSLRFAFRTVQTTGLILFNGKYAQDFIAVELVHGTLHLVFDMGNGAQSLSSSSRRPLNDNQWHSVEIGRPGRTDHVLVVDGEKWVLVDVKEKSRLNLQGSLYVGGLPGRMFASLPRSVRSQTGFSGCLAGLTINGVVVDLVGGVKVKSDMVVAGCQGPRGECGKGAVCQHGGRCVQQWMGFGCDCEMTSFTGSTCSNYSTAYRFGPLPGLVIYHFDAAQRPDSRSDRIAFGLVTSEDEALICRIGSFTSEDVIEFQIVAGHLFVVYNMGNYAHLISDFQHRLNDGRYHVVRFERDGANATLQIDGHEPVIKVPSGKQHDIFNGISTVEIGGKLNARHDDIERAFQGVIAGLVINGIRILDLAADADGNVLLEGHPELVSDMEKELQATNASFPEKQQPAEWMDQMQHTDVTHHGPDTKASDDLFVATPAPCKVEDTGCTLTNSQKNDDLIFASFTIVKTTTVFPKTTTTASTLSTTAKRVISSPRSVICDDEEDCDTEASGDASPLAARSALSRSTRPPIIINVTFTTPPPFTTPVSNFRTAESIQTPFPKPTFTVTLPPGKLGTYPTFPPAPVLSTTTAPPGNPLDIFRENAALIAGIAVGVVILVALIVFLAVRYRKNGRPVTTAAAADGAKTYQTFSKPEPSPAGTMQRNGHARPVQAGGNGTLGRNKDKEYYV